MGGRHQTPSRLPRVSGVRVRTERSGEAAVKAALDQAGLWVKCAEDSARYCDTELRSVRDSA